MKLAFDMELRRPACVLVAAALGADTWPSQEFPSETWLLVPTPDMKVYEIDAETLARVAAQVAKEHAR